MPIRLAVCDDHRLVVSGIRNALNVCDHIHVIADYASGKELLDGLAIEQPDILLLDIQLPDISGTELAGMISKQYPDVKIIALTSVESVAQVKAMLMHKCRGYVLKTNTDHKMLIDVIEQVYDEKIYIDNEVKELVMQDMVGVRHYNRSTAPKITRREREILQLIVNEHSNQEIADKLHLSLYTVENHRFNLMRKLNAKNTAGLVRIALKNGMAE